MIIGILSDDFYPQEDNRWGGTGWARIAKYLEWLPANWDVHIATQIWPADPYGIAITTTDGKKVYPEVLWCQRVFMPGFPYQIMQARLAGQRVVTDIDDLLWGLHKDSFARLTWTSEQVQTALESLQVSDAVTVSTSWLQNSLMHDFRIPSVVVRNTVDVGEFNPVPPSQDPTIGWAGAVATRSGDLEILTDVLPEMKKLASIQHSGHMEGWYGFAEKTGVSPDKVVGMAHPQDYPSILTFDVGMVPLSVCDFNKAKSDIKGIEYAAAGIPFVASPLPAYKQLQKEWGPIVRLARTTEEWISHLTDLMDFDTRVEEGAELRRLAWKRDIPTVTPALVGVLSA